MYTTVAAVRLATGFSDTAKITTARIEQYIGDADSTINSYLVSIYTLPLASTPSIIEMISRWLAIGLLYADEYGEESQNLDKGWEKRLAWAKEMLESIKKQEVKLVSESGATAGQELARATLMQPTSLPNDTTSDPSYIDSTAPKVSMNTQY